MKIKYAVHVVSTCCVPMFKHSDIVMRAYFSHLDQLGGGLQMVEGEQEGLPGLSVAEVSSLEAHLQEPQDAGIIDLHHQIQKPLSDQPQKNPT